MYTYILYIQCGLQNRQQQNKMLKHDQLRHPLKVITILSSLALLLQIGALACQLYWQIFGFNSTQYVYVTANAAITTILNNNVLFQLVAFICAIVAVLCLMVMLIIVIVGLCRWRNDHSLNYVQTGGMNNDVNQTNMQLNPQQANTATIPQSQTNNLQANTTNIHANATATTIDPLANIPNDYFVYPKIMAGCMLYLFAWICILGNMGLMITIFVCLILGYGSSPLAYAIIGGLSFIAYIFVLVCFIFWHKLRCLINSNIVQSSPAAQGKQMVTAQNEQRPNQPLMQTEEQLNTQQNQMQNINNFGNNKYMPNRQSQSHLQSQQQQGNNLLGPQDNKNTSPQYATFNGGQERPKQQQLAKNSKDNIRGSMNSDLSNQKKATPKFIHDQSSGSHGMNKKYDSKSNKDKQKGKDEIQVKGQQKAQCSNIQSNNILGTKSGISSGKNKDGLLGKQNAKQQQGSSPQYNIKNSRRDAMINNEGRPYFKSPTKPKEPQPSYYKSPLDKYTDPPKPMNVPKPVQQPQFTPPPPKLKSSVDPMMSGEQQMHSSQFKASVNRPAMPRADNSDLSSSSPRGRIKNDTSRKNQALMQSNQQKMKKQKKSGMLIDYIRSKYAD